MIKHQIKINKQKTEADLQTLYLTIAGCVQKQRPGVSDWRHFSLALRSVMIQRWPHKQSKNEDRVNKDHMYFVKKQDHTP